MVVRQDQPRWDCKAPDEFATKCPWYSQPVESSATTLPSPKTSWGTCITCVFLPCLYPSSCRGWKKNADFPLPVWPSSPAAAMLVWRWQKSWMVWEEAVGRSRPPGNRSICPKETGKQQGAEHRMRWGSKVHQSVRFHLQNTNSKIKSIQYLTLNPNFPGCRCRKLAKQWEFAASHAFSTCVLFCLWEAQNQN